MEFLVFHSSFCSSPLAVHHKGDFLQTLPTISVSSLWSSWKTVCKKTWTPFICSPELHSLLLVLSPDSTYSTTMLTELLQVSGFFLPRQVSVCLSFLPGDTCVFLESGPAGFPATSTLQRAQEQLRACCLSRFFSL